MSLVSIVIPVYGQGLLTRQCLEALARDPASLALIREVILVDNGATLPDPELDLAAVGPQILGMRLRYLPQPVNRNFAGACNLGAAEAKAPLLCLLNSDTIPQPGWLPALAEALENASAAGPLLLYPPTTATPCPRVQHLGICFSPQLAVSHLYERFPLGHRVIRRRAFQALSAAAFLLPRSLFLDLNGFDERFRNGFEDVELCARLKQRGHTLVCQPSSQVWHLCGQSAGRKDHEDHNRRILAGTTAPATFTPDEHLLLSEDGYQLTLLPHLAWRADLPQRELSRLARLLVPAPNLDELVAALQAEPLWHPGRAALSLAMATGNPALALSLAWDATFFDPGPDPLRLLADLAPLLDDPTLAAQAGAALSSFPPAAAPEQVRAFRAFLRRACPELVPQADHLLLQG